MGGASEKEVSPFDFDDKHRASDSEESFEEASDNDESHPVKAMVGCIFMCYSMCHVLDDSDEVVKQKQTQGQRGHGRRCDQGGF